MDIRQVGLAAITVVAFSVSNSYASPETAASGNACARAFVMSIGSTGTAAPSYKLAYRGNSDAGPLSGFYRSQYTFDLEVIDPKTGVTVARARCSTLHGAVVELTSIPLRDKPVAHSAAR
jgi:hypothetical protein